MQTTTPPQADTDRTRRRTFRADESADRTRHSSAPTYSTLTAVPAEPPSTWRERNIEWVTGPFDDLGRSLPDIVPVPILNEHGVEHRLAAFMACHWPENGALSTPGPHSVVERADRHRRLMAAAGSAPGRRARLPHDGGNNSPRPAPDEPTGEPKDPTAGPSGSPTTASGTPCGPAGTNRTHRRGTISSGG